jgi:hypothetical protein
MKIKSLLLIVLISFVPVLQVTIYAQNAFPYGTWLNDNDSVNQDVYSKVNELGMNYLVQYARAGSDEIKAKLNPYNLIAVKEDKPEDYIGHYARGYYCKWESEENQLDSRIVGVKHNAGLSTTYNNVTCWSSQGAQSQTLNIVNGPDYKQDKKYRLSFDNTQINYTVNFNMAYIPAYNEQLDNVACRIGVRYKYQVIINGVGQIITDETFPTMQIKVSDLSASFQKKSLDYNYQNYLSAIYADSLLSVTYPSTLVYDDGAWGTGIEFYIDFLGQGTLYVDYIEVYDQAIWRNNFIIADQAIISANKIKAFANSYSDWTKLQYFYAADEPQTIDQYEPIRFVDSVLNANGNKRIISAFYPQWNGARNGEYTTQRYKEQANPQTIMTDYYPFFIGTSNQYNFSLERDVLQQISEQDKKFWFMPQAFGEYITGTSNQFHWRKPSFIELNASIMLALAHGAKGLMFWKMTTSEGYEESLPGDWGNVIFDGLLHTDYSPTTMYDSLKTYFTPRINGKLGQILINLDYTGGYIHGTWHGVYPDYLYSPECAPLATLDYLNLYPHNPDYDWHIGLFTYHNQSDNKFFMLVNLRTDGNREAKFSINNYVPHKNLRVRDYENPSSFDHVITSQTTFTITVPAGDGRLFQVIPVVKYGGYIIDNEMISDICTLSDSIIIKQGATLTITGTYNANANIIVEPGGNIIVAPGGHLNFASGCSLIYTCPQITLKALIEGFYNGSTMVPDTITAELHNAVSPYSVVASNKGVLDSTGYGTFFFTSAANDTSYYIVIRYRNALETWSAFPHYFTGDTLSYDFTTDSTKAYGNNMMKKNGRWCHYSGDVNQDGIVDSGDLSLVDSDVSNYVTGYVNTDVNGDEIVDSNDSGIVDNNNSNYVCKIVPEGAAAKVIRHFNQQRKTKITSK